MAAFRRRLERKRKNIVPHVVERFVACSIVVFKDGCRTWRRDSVVVARDRCHVQTVRLDVDL